jgi:hypothetical protein
MSAKLYKKSFYQYHGLKFSVLSLCGSHLVALHNQYKLHIKCQIKQKSTSHFHQSVEVCQTEKQNVMTLHLPLRVSILCVIHSLKNSQLTGKYITFTLKFTDVNERVVLLHRISKHNALLQYVNDISCIYINLSQREKKLYYKPKAVFISEQISPLLE